MNETLHSIMNGTKGVVETQKKKTVVFTQIDTTKLRFTVDHFVRITNSSNNVMRRSWTTPISRYSNRNRNDRCSLHLRFYFENSFFVWICAVEYDDDECFKWTVSKSYTKWNRDTSQATSYSMKSPLATEYVQFVGADGEHRNVQFFHAIEGVCGT